MKKRGISLIVLVITIIITIIIVGAIVLSISKNTPIFKAEEANFKTNLKSYESELALNLSGLYLSNNSFDPYTFDVDAWTEGSNTEDTIKKYIPSMTDEDAKKFKIENAELVYIGEDEFELLWSLQVLNNNEDILVSEDIPTTEEFATHKIKINTIATENSTITGEEYSYDNPIIPVGFKAINTDIASWDNMQWNEGLVIEDLNSNQFVWVPVDGNNVVYSRDSSYKLWANAPFENIADDDTLPVTAENYQIEQYKGFYIARYEAGKEETDTLVSKQGATVWTNINKTNSKIKSEDMYNNEYIKSGLVTGIQWDTILEWIRDSGKSVTNPGAWGNYDNSISPANIDGKNGSKSTSGYSEYWRAKNIYDLAGNFWEWTSEKYNDEYVNRGGDYTCPSGSYPVSYRNYNGSNFSCGDLSFRVVLYIL